MNIRAIKPEESKMLNYVLQQAGASAYSSLLKLNTAPGKWIGAFAEDGRLTCAAYVDYDVQKNPIAVMAVPDKWRDNDSIEYHLSELTSYFMTAPDGSETRNARISMIGEPEPIEVKNRAVSDDEPRQVVRLSEPKRICWEAIKPCMANASREYTHHETFGNISKTEIGTPAPEVKPSKVLGGIQIPLIETPAHKPGFAETIRKHMNAAGQLGFF